MTQTTGAIDDFGMDTITLAGSLENKLQAMRDAGFSQVMLKANDIVGHAGGVDAAVRAVQASGLRVTGFQVLRDFEGLSVPPACLQGRHRQGHAGDGPCAGRAAAAGLQQHQPARHAGPGRHRARPAQARHAGRAAGHQDRLRGPELGPHHQRVHHRLGGDLPRRCAQSWASAIDSFHAFASNQHAAGRAGHAGRAQDLPGAAVGLHVAGGPARWKSASAPRAPSRLPR